MALDDDEVLPTAGLYIGDDEVNLYTEIFNQLLADIGHSIKLHLPPKKIDCVNCGWDNARKRSNRRYTPGGPQSFPNGGKCPWCDGRGRLITPRNKTYTALIDNFPKDIVIFEGTVNARKNKNEIVTLTQIIAIQNIEDAESMEYKGRFYKLIEMPDPTGLRDTNFVLAKWAIEDRTQ